MFSNLGMWELLFIAGIALVVMGPEKFPEFAKVVMRTYREVRGFWDDAKRDITNELRPVKNEMRQLSQYKPEDYIDSLMEDEDEPIDDVIGDPYGLEEDQEGDYAGEPAEAPVPGDDVVGPEPGEGVTIYEDQPDAPEAEGETELTDAPIESGEDETQGPERLDG